ncbi:nuclear receptor subfamily 1 group D member 1-like isoform X2 [Paramacrobiotus metropolitanus]|uniref:nuclear receptor subfamily 1 group D member 1-like isoform X2 n=1 Tax=Paramacrobiotus metropolitanus TaxID=2943436 RepID=UPI002446367A|nr:nuclear receptor subfamily 1 group D member 1-like isoform X2 [Paramacrobiotus metropolitanus]
MEINIPIPKGRGFTPFPFGQCQICGAEATGNHYGANTCEGCKGFFKRSLPVFRTFRCFFGNRCEVSPDTRNRCKACRFRKCIEAGMALDAVKMGRIPKAVKEQAVRSAGGSSSAATSGEASSSGDNVTGPSHTRQPTPTTPSPPSNIVLLNRSISAAEATAGSSGQRYTVIRSSSQVEAGNHSAALGTVHYPQSSSLSGHRFHPYHSSSNTPIDKTKAQPLPMQEQSDDEDVSMYEAPTYSGSYQPGPSRPSTSRYSPPARKDAEMGSTMTDTGRTIQHEDGHPRTLDGYVIPSSPNARFTGSGGVCYPAVRKTGQTIVFSQLPVVVKPSHLPEVVDMAITGQKVNENVPGLKALPADQLTAEMATDETAVAVLEPIVQGSKDCAPVVPRDIVIMTPSYVPPEKIPAPPQPTSTHHRYRKTRKDGSSSSESSLLSPSPHLKIPAVITSEFFHELGKDENAKNSMCEYTFRIVSKKNNEIYGEETRANEVFLKEALTSNNLPNQPERTPLQMRDILKDRLVTQVKRVVMLSESIPGFRFLDMHDQHSLLRTCILDTWMVHSARFLRNQQSYILFLETNTFYARYWMEQFLTDEFLMTVFEMASRINALDLSFDELSLLKCILIVRPDRPGLNRVDFITEILIC